MREAWKNCVRAVISACVLGIAAAQQSAAAAPQGRAERPLENFGTAHRLSPTGEVLVSWTFDRDTLGSSLEIVRVEDTEVTAKYEAGFPIENVEFSLSGRFMCITGRVLTFDTQGRPQERSRVAVVDTERAFARLLFLSGTWIGVFQGHTSKGTSHRCLPPPATMSPKLDFDGRVNRMVRNRIREPAGRQMQPRRLALQL